MEYINELLSRYRQKGILIDTNILLLYFVGTVNRERISKFKRTQQFIPEDYDLLQSIIAYFRNIVTTPNILTEVNSLTNQLSEPERSRCLAEIAQGFTAFFNEFYVDSKTISTDGSFIRFGLTDSGILQLARNQYLVLTDDLKLSVHLEREEVDVINFNQLRTLGW
jgi:rRNA-processing protein FCF1